MALRKIGWSFLLTIAIAPAITAQPEVGFCRFYRERDYSTINDVFTVGDGGYVACGSAGWSWILRTDDEGQEIWSRTYEQYEHPRSIIEADDGDFVAGGGWGAAGNVFGAMRVRSDGAPVWDHTYGSGVCFAVIELKSGVFVLAGYCVDQDETASGYLVCIDGDGDVLWRHVYQFDQGRISEGFHSIRETEDGIVVAGIVNQLTWVLKVDFEGAVVWSRRIGGEGEYISLSMVSNPGGFALAGYASANPQDMWQKDFLLVVVDNDGQLVWDRRYDFGGNVAGHNRFNMGYCLTRLARGGYIIAGTDGIPHPRIQNAMYYLPTVICTDDNGELLWGREYELDNAAGVQNFFTTVINGDDSAVVVAGQVHNRQGDWSYDGVLMSLVGANPGGGGNGGRRHFALFRYSPARTDFPVLEQDSIRFICRAIDNEHVEADYYWQLDGDTVSVDTTLLVSFDTLGQQRVSCKATRDELFRDVDWQVHVTRVYIDDFSCDTTRGHGDSLTNTELTIKRGQSVNFRIHARRQPGAEPEYRWYMTDRDGFRAVVGEDSNLTQTFPLAGDFQIDGMTSLDEDSDTKTWIVHVRSLIWSWYPEPFNLTVPPDSMLFFRIQPVAGQADSVTYTWASEGRVVSRADTLLTSFADTGLHRVSVNITKRRETEHLQWSILVVQPENSSPSTTPPLPAATGIVSVTPNPFNSTAWIEFDLTANRLVNFDVLDVQGRRVAHIANGHYAVGRHRVLWEARDQPTGVYFVRLREGEVSSIQKVVLVR